MSCIVYTRKDVEKIKKIAKKFVCYQEGAELYCFGLNKFQELAPTQDARQYKLDFVKWFDYGTASNGQKKQREILNLMRS